MRAGVDELVDSFKEVNAMKVFRSVSLCIGLGLLSWANSLSAHEASKINTESLLRKYFRSEMLSTPVGWETAVNELGLMLETSIKSWLKKLRRLSYNPWLRK